MVKMSKKDCKNVLTKTKRSDNICKHSARGARATERNARKKTWKKLKKSLEKVLTKGVRYGILFELSRKRAANWTLKIKQRDKKRNPRFDGSGTINEEF